MRLVATDIDGTIVRRDLGVSPRTVAALKACSAAAVDVVLVTGRPVRWVEPLAHEIGFTGTAVCANGAVVHDLAGGRTVTSHTIPPDVVRQVVARGAISLPGVDVAIETIEGFRRTPGYLTRWDTVSDQEVGSLDELLDDDPGVIKVLLRQEGGTADAMLAAARPAIGDLGEVTHSNARDCMVEVSAPGVSKAATLAVLAAERGIDAADVVAFGDMPNDLLLLRWAGRGYAMADGHPDAVAAADEIAPPCADDGVAQVIEKLLTCQTDITQRRTRV